MSEPVIYVNGEEAEQIALEEVWPDQAAFIADLDATFTDTTIVNYAAMKATNFIKWLYFGVSNQFYGNYIAYDTEALFLRHFTHKFAQYSQQFFARYQLYLAKIAGVSVAEMMKSGVLTRSEARDATLIKTGTDTSVHTGTDTIAHTGSDTNYIRNADTPTDIDAATPFIDNYSDQQSKGVLTKATTDANTKNLTDAETKNLTDTTNDDLAISESNDLNIAEAIKKYQSINASLLKEFTTLFTQDFITVYAID